MDGRLDRRADPMRLPVDDEIYNVNAVWLGPPSKTLPFRARYVAYAVGTLVFVLLQIIERRLGIGLVSSASPTACSPPSA